MSGHDEVMVFGGDHGLMDLDCDLGLNHSSSSSMPVGHVNAGACLGQTDLDDLGAEEVLSAQNFVVKAESKQVAITKIQKTKQCILQRPLMTACEMQAAILWAVGSMSACSFCLELFAGCAVFTAAMVSLGSACVALDNLFPLGALKWLLRIDLQDDCVISAIASLVKTNRCKGLGGGLHCNTFSLAQRGKRKMVMHACGTLEQSKTGFPVALRPEGSEWGLPRGALSDKDWASLQSENSSTKRFVLLLVLAVQCSCVAWLGNPEPSYVWKLVADAVIAKLQLGPGDVHWLIFSQCLFGTAWKKDTQILLMNGCVRRPDVWRKCKCLKSAGGPFL